METRAVEKRNGSRITQHAAAISAAMNGMSFGLALGWTAAADAVLKGAQGFSITMDEWSWVGSIYPLGAVLGAIVVVPLIEKFGRRYILFASHIPSLIGAIMFAVANNIWWLYLGRFAVGIGTGFSGVVTPIYTSEISESSIRGFLTSYFELLLAVGILIVYLVGANASVLMLNVTCMIPPILGMLSLLWFAETPRWLLIKGRVSEARKSLIFYRGKDYNIDSEFSEMETALNEKKNNQVQGLAALTTRGARYGFIITIGLMFFQQMVGINAVTFSANLIFQEAGTLLSNTVSLASIALAQLIAVILSMVVIDRLGRRVLLFASGATMAVSCALLGAYFYFKDLGFNVTPINWSPVVLSSIYVFMFSVGYGPVPWVVMGEITTDNVKGITSSAANVSTWIFAFIVTKFFNDVNASLGIYSAFWMFAGISLLACIFVFFVLPETKGKTLDEIQNIFERNKATVGAPHSTTILA